MLNQPEPACLVIADISGYTGFLAGAELDHAQDILADLMATVVGGFRPSLAHESMSCAHAAVAPSPSRTACAWSRWTPAASGSSPHTTPKRLPGVRVRSYSAVSPNTVTAIGATGSGGSVTVPLESATLAEALAEIERKMIAEALRKHGGNISRAARELGLTRRGLYLKLDRYEMSASA